MITSESIGIGHWSPRRAAVTGSNPDIRELADHSFEKITQLFDLYCSIQSTNIRVFSDSPFHQSTIWNVYRMDRLRCNSISKYDNFDSALSYNDYITVLRVSWTISDESHFVDRFSCSSCVIYIYSSICFLCDYSGYYPFKSNQKSPHKTSATSQFMIDFAQSECVHFII